MKRITNIFRRMVVLTLVGSLFACNDFLDREPLSQVTPEAYLTEESQLAAYDNELYNDILPSHSNWSFGTFGDDKNTDNMANKTYDNKFAPGQWKVQQTQDGDWKFTNIYSCNYFFDQVLPKWRANSLSGSKVNIDHYIGEMYTLRAYEYFKKLQLFGDFPIIKTVIVDQMTPLVDASKRSPRNEVARFILSDLDSAIVLLKETAPDGNKNRINKATAQLIKSRVALYEGTFLKYFKGTAFVPQGEGWPGKTKEYTANYQYPSGNIDAEIEYFLTQAMDASKAVADNYALTNNTGALQQSATDVANPYYDMYSSVDLSGAAYSEVLLWREYNKGLGMVNNVPVNAQSGNYGIGLTRGMVDGFLMANGLPIYAAGSGYKGDDYIADVRDSRDGRLWLFLKEPGQKNVLIESTEGDHATLVEPIPDITAASVEKTYSTGYTIRKGASFDQAQCGNGGGSIGSITFRATEAYLNYVEACYEKNGALDNSAITYWKAIRTRAKVNDDFTVTIAATNMAEEAKNDWGAYSAGQLIDPTLYNIRRERRCELMAEALRFMDLQRWRAMDQMITTPYHVEGFKIWGPMKQWYLDANVSLAFGSSLSTATVSDPALSSYLRPYEISSKSLVFDGYRWNMAHYLQPIAAQNFLITSSDGNASSSPIYQNPGWPMTANSGPVN